jgi:hypothetical protein
VILLKIEVVSMSTRMQRYYKEENKNSRSARNRELYKDIYEYGEYSNIEGIASLSKTNEIDITKVKEMIESRENYHKRKQYYKEPLQVEETIEKTEPLEERNYDIRDILVKAKETKPKDDKERVLRDSKYDFLNKVKQKSENKETSEDELKDLINTITSTSMLNKLGDNTLAMELFSDLTDNEESPKTLKEYENKEPKVLKNDYTETSLDKSFFTSSLNLNKSDFIENEEDDEKEKTSIFSIIIIIILVIIIIACIGILVYKRFM